MSDPIVTVLSRLRERGHEPRETTNGWESRCPAHEDKTASLSVGAGGDGRALLTCHAGCKFDEIVGSLGIEVKDLFADDARAPSRSLATTKPKTPAQTFATADDAIKALAHQRGGPTTTWQYHDAECGVVGVICRWDRADGGKAIRPISRQVDGSWALSGMVEPRPLYGLPELLAGDDVVFVAEGEKAADALRSVGVTSTTSAHGSQSARQTDWSPLAGRTVVVVPDHDAPGEAYAADVAKLATAASAKSVAIVRLVDVWPGMPAGGDAHDWIAHHDAVEPEVFRGMLAGLVAKAEPVAMPATSLMPVPVDVSDEVDLIPLQARQWPSRPSTMLSHGVIGNLLSRVEAETEADPVAIAVTFLVSLGSVIGRGPHAIVDGNRHGVNLFATIVGGTSEGRKGTSMSIVRAVFRDVDGEWCRNCRTPGLTSGEGLIDLIRDDVYSTRENKKTGELEDYISAPGVIDKRLIFECQEFAAVMRAGKSERSTLFPTMREAWDGQDLRTPTKNNPRRVTGPHISGVAHITPEELYKLQTDADIFGGTWNRFLWIGARRARLCPHGGDFEDLRDIQDRVRSVVNHSQNVGRMRRTEAANRLWEAEYYRRADNLPGGIVGAILGRAEAQILRLSMLAALCRGETVVDEVDLAAALDLWRYSDETARSLFGHNEDPIVQKIVQAVRDSPGISRSELRRAVARATPVSVFMAALSRAASMGGIVPGHVETHGRPREEWRPRGLEKAQRPPTRGFCTLNTLNPTRSVEVSGAETTQTPTVGMPSATSKHGRTL